MPYNDDYLVYDYKLHRYILTLKYVNEVLGINLEARIKSNNGYENAIKSRLNLVSLEIYNYLYSFQRASTIQYLVAKTEDGREIIKDAMGMQLLYILQNGDVTFSTDDRLAGKGICEQSLRILNGREIEETGAVLGYRGRYILLRVPSYETGEY